MYVRSWAWHAIIFIDAIVLRPFQAVTATTLADMVTDA
jgi:hypothetical protein